MWELGSAGLIRLYFEASKSAGEAPGIRPGAGRSPMRRRAPGRTLARRGAVERSPGDRVRVLGRGRRRIGILGVSRRHVRSRAAAFPWAAYDVLAERPLVAASGLTFDGLRFDA